MDMPSFNKKRPLSEVAMKSVEPSLPAPEAASLELSEVLPITISEDEIAQFLEAKGITNNPNSLRENGLTKDDLETLQVYLAHDYISHGFREARSIELRSKPSYALSAATQKLYKGQVRRLTETNENNDPYNQFSMLTISSQTRAETVSNGVYQSKAALNRLASRAMLEDLPQLYTEILAFLKQSSAAKIKQDRTDEERQKIAETYKQKALALTKWRNRHYKPQDSNVDNSVGKPVIDADFLLSIARAAKFLNDFPPDIHGIRGREAIQTSNRKAKGTARKPARTRQDLIDNGVSDLIASLETAPRKVKSGKAKRPVLARIGLKETRQRKLNPTFDWRSHVWKTAVNDPHIDDSKRALVAIQIALGPRPVEIAMGVNVHVLRAANTDDHYKILVRIAGAKTGDADYLDEEHRDYHKTDDDHAAIEQLKSDTQVMDFNSKGQVWKLFEIDCAFPEMRWLADYVRRVGLPLDDDYAGSLYADEAQAFGAYAKDITHSAFMGFQVKHHDIDRARQMTASERDMNAANSFSNMLVRLGKSAFPKLPDRLTGYVYRHALASDLKAAEVDPEVISQTVGHISGRITQRYGSNLHATKRTYSNRASAISKRFTASPVRNTAKRTPFYATQRNNGALKR